MTEFGTPEDIPLERLQLNLANPRHEEVDDRDSAMVQLLQNEQVLELARDIVALGGINPLERMGVYPLEGTEDDDEPLYTAAEGNRRLCALILLDDPDAIPADMPNRTRYVRSFNQLASRIPPIETVPCVIFPDLNAARPWLERLHNGARDGTGRRRWTPEQQARNTNDRTNRAATQLRDLAIALGLVTPAQLSRTTTTQQRFISNERFRQALGIVKMPDGSLQRVSCWNDFNLMLSRFIADVVSGGINSRSHNSSAQIEAYAQNLESLEGLRRRTVVQGPLEQRPGEANPGEEDTSESADSGEAGHGPAGGDSGTGSERGASDTGDEGEEPGDDDDEGGDGGSVRRPPRAVIGQQDEIMAALHRLNNQKLTDLYTSLATVRHPKHTLLAIIGCWSFLECLTRANGRAEATAFDAYINGKVRDLGVEARPDRRVRRMALEWIRDGGNITKHDWQTAGYDYRQLFNFMDALTPIIVALIDDTADQGNREP